MKIKRGEIRLPEMQRQYVWQKTKVRDLLDSLYREYPSGTILTWETDEPVSTQDFAVDQEATKQGDFQLLLDGQQRLTALSALLRGQPVTVSDRKSPIDILFNLEHPDNLEGTAEVSENKEIDGETDVNPDESTADAPNDEIQERFNRMAFVVHSNKLANSPHWVSVTEVFSENSDKPFLKKAGINVNDERYDKYTDRLQKLRNIKDYTYRVHLLGREKSYEEVTEIFVRVNSLGTRLRSSDLALAQITAKWPGSLKLFQEFGEKCKKDGFDLDLSVHLRSLIVFASKQCRFKIVGNLSREQLEEAWKDAKQGIEFSIDFLRSNMDIDNPSLLSSSSIMIMLAAYAHSRNYRLKHSEDSYLKYYILVSNAKARYSKGSSETLLDQDLAAIYRKQGVNALLRILNTQVGRLEVAPEDLETSSNTSSYFKTMFMAFKKGGACDWHNRLTISLKHSGAQNVLQFHHIFPKSILKKSNLSPQKINDICNLAFIGGKTNRTINNKEPSEYFPEIIKQLGSNDQLSKQCIPDDPSLWRVEEYENFLKKRRELVADKLNHFLGHEEWKREE